MIRCAKRMLHYPPDRCDAHASTGRSNERLTVFLQRALGVIVACIQAKVSAVTGDFLCVAFRQS